MINTDLATLFILDPLTAINTSQSVILIGITHHGPAALAAQFTVIQGINVFCAAKRSLTSLTTVFG